MAKVSYAQDWIDGDNLMLLECWARDGYTYGDIANKIGIGEKTLRRWRKEFPEIQEALRAGREIIDYKVENALLKAALGYRTKETRVLISLNKRTGLMETVEKETVDKEQPPNVRACEVWLFNRLPDKWKRNRDKYFEIDDNETTITISVQRQEDESVQTAVHGVKTTKPIDENEETDEDWVDEVNTSVTVRRNQNFYDKKNEPKTDEEDRDYWPDDFEY